jgi:hypothetical protein
MLTRDLSLKWKLLGTYLFRGEGKEILVSVTCR